MTRTLPRQPPARILALAAVILSSLAIAARTQADKPPRPTFATVAIHPTLANRHVSGISISPPGRFTATATTAQDLIFYAYDERTIDGGPDWMASARFDIDAKIDDSAVAAWKKLSSLERDNQTRGMVRALLEDKFKLQVKHEKQDSEVYALVVAKDGRRFLPLVVAINDVGDCEHEETNRPQIPKIHDGRDREHQNTIVKGKPYAHLAEFSRKVPANGLVDLSRRVL